MKNIPAPLILTLAICSLLTQRSFAQFGSDNPTGVTGEFNGSVTTAGSYDPYTGNAKRFVDDLTVTGSIGAYPLKWTRVLNTRAAVQWSHSYAWKLWVRPYQDYEQFPDKYDGPGGVLSYPDGRTLTFAAPREPYSYEASSHARGLDWLEHVGDGNFDVLLHDGGKVRFRHPPGSTRGSDLRAIEIVDPYGQTTSLIRDSADRLWQIREPGGRYLQINYTTYSRVYDGDTLYWDVISSVEAYSAPGQLTETVTYNYNTFYSIRTTSTFLTQANYDDDSRAIYTYEDGAGNPAPTGLIKSCDDVRFAGPMKRIKYEYATHHDTTEPIAIGQIKAEKNLTTGQTVSEVIYPQGPFSLTVPDPRKYVRTERKGGGATREFQYRADWTDPELESYTDFKNQRSYMDQSIGSWGKYVTNLTNARGHRTAIEKDVYSDAVELVTHPDGSTKRFTYTNHYYVASQTDERGNTTYHDRYDSGPHKNRVWRIRYPNGGEEQFTYNPFGQVETHTMLSGGVENFRYDGRGRKYLYWPPATESDPNPEQHPTQYFYYESGPHTDRLRLVVDPRGNATAYEYNLRGQVTKVQHQDWTYTQSEYNPDGTLAWTADENHPNASWNENERTRYIYDEYKRVLTVTNPMGEITTTSYAIDLGWAHPLLHTTNSIKYVITPGGKNTVFDYDANFRKTHQAVALGTPDEAWTLFEYDAVGNLTKTTDPRFKVTTFGYDARNRKIWMDSPIASDRNGNGHTMEWKYDGVGDKTKEIRADNAFRSWEYDIPNRTTRSIDWRMNESEPAITTNYTRDVQGLTEWITDAKGATYTFTFDQLHRKTSVTYPADAYGAARTQNYWYDVAGNLRLYKNPANQYKHLDYADSYDSRNRLRHSAWNFSASSNAPDWNAGQETITNYDGASRMTSISTNGGETTVSFGYDDANRQIWEDQTLAGYAPRRISTPRDADGNRQWLDAAGINHMVYQYNQRNQLAHILNGDVDPFYDFSYDAAGNMTQRQSRVWYTSVTNFEYDALNRVTMGEQGASGWIFARSWYQYDNVGRERATWRDENHGLGSQRGERFEYDPTNQLKKVSYDAQNVWTGTAENADKTQEYAYTPDKLNRQSVTENGVVTSYSASALNQYQSFGGVVYNYDYNFNLREAPNWWGGFDAESRLTMAGGGGNVVSFTYDGLGRCVRRIVYPPGGGSSAVIYIYDGWKPVLEFDGAGHYRASNVYGAGADEILFRWDTVSGGSIYKQDRHGNVVAVLDQWGNIVERYSYDAFGKPKIMSWWDNVERVTSWYGNRFQFQGREWIPELGIYDYRNRMYHPGLGRFLQTDPIGLQTEGVKLTPGQKALFSPGGTAPEAFGASETNLYRYCGDDPINKSDPLGLYWSADRSIYKKVEAAWKHLSKDPGMKAMIDAIARSGTEVHVRENKSLDRNKTVTEQVTNAKTGEVSYRISWNPHAASSFKGGTQSPAMVLGHEGQHVLRDIHDWRGAKLDLARGAPGFGNVEERRVILGPETEAARNLQEGVRSEGYAALFEVNDVTDR